MNALAGKRAIVTGAAKGIGAAIARRFAAEGAELLLVDMDEANGGALAASLGGRFLAADLSDKAQIDALFDQIEQRWDRLDVLVNNAGVMQAAKLDDLTEAQFDLTLAINVKAPTFMTQRAARLMGEGSAIINMSSVNAVVGIPDQIPYVVSKGAIAQLTKATALALAPRGIRVNAIGPGTIMTDLGRQVMDDPERERIILSRTPLGRIGRPEEIAAVALFLASQESSYMTGQTIYADGGRLSLNTVVPTNPKGREIGQ